MASDKRPPITLACETCKRRNYVTTKSKANTRERLELKKYCRWCRTPHPAPRDALANRVGGNSSGGRLVRPLACATVTAAMG